MKNEKKVKKMDTKLILKEEDRVQEEWYTKAKIQTLESLPEFLRHLSEDYAPDYGTICHALAAGAVATTWALNNSKAGGITGFQAGVIMWEYMAHWNHVTYPARLILYEDMLYPQYNRKFEKVIDLETWHWLQKQAKDKLINKSKENVSIDVRKHWEAIVAGNVPFGYVVKDL